MGLGCWGRMGVLAPVLPSRAGGPWGPRNTVPGNRATWDGAFQSLLVINISPTPPVVSFPHRAPTHKHMPVLIRKYELAFFGLSTSNCDTGKTETIRICLCRSINQCFMKP